jgi:hypothetical protein
MQNTPERVYIKGDSPENRISVTLKPYEAKPGTWFLMVITGQATISTFLTPEEHAALAKLFALEF